MPKAIMGPKKLFLAAALLLTGACEKPYEVVRFASPNPFVRAGCKLTIERLDERSLLVGDETEAQYLGHMDAVAARSHQQDMTDGEARFRQRLVRDRPSLYSGGGTPDNTFDLRPIWTRWRPGTSYPRVPGVAELTVQVLDAGGKLLDEIRVRGIYPGGWDTGFASPDVWSSGGRMRGALENAGAAITKYLDDRWVCAR
jgi:hypothetical protein